MLGRSTLHEARLDSALVEHPVDLHQAVAVVAEVHGTANARQHRTQGRLINEDRREGGGGFLVHRKKGSSPGEPAAGL